MNANNNSRLALIVAMTVLSTTLFAQSSVNVQSVDNYAGYSNVYTDAANTDVKVTELDSDGKPVRSWTGKTDDKGKITIPAGSNISKPYIRVVRTGSMPEATLPSSIDSNMPFSFSTGGNVSGEVVSFQQMGGTASGQIIAQSKTDSKGRIFMAAGMAAGLYNLIIGNGAERRVSQVAIKPNDFSTLAGPAASMAINPIQTPLNCDQMVRLAGSGLNANPESLIASFASGGQGSTGPNTAAIPQWLKDLLDGKYLISNLDVVAATPNELVLSSPKASGVNSGSLGKIRVLDQASGRTAESNYTFSYDAKAKLSRSKEPSGADTMLQIMVTPRISDANVRASVASGPVWFEGGARQVSLAAHDGSCTIPIFTKPGSEGNFDVNWEIDWSSIMDAISRWEQLQANTTVNASQDTRPGSRKAGHVIKRADGGWTDEYTDYDADGNRIGSTAETYDKSGQMRERKTNRIKEGNGTITTDTYDKDGKWTGTKTETFKDGKQTAGTQTSPDGKGGTKTQTWDPKTGTYK